MTSPLLENSVDAFTWFKLKSQSSVEKCSHYKIQALLYLAQCYYGVAMDSEKFMPSVFIATKTGPADPNLAKLLPYLSSNPTIYEIPSHAIALMESIWRKYVEVPEEKLINQIKNGTPFQKAYQKGENSEILLSDMVKFYKTKTKSEPPKIIQKDKLAIDKKSVIMKNEQGNAVKVSTWKPKRI